VYVAGSEEPIVVGDGKGAVPIRARLEVSAEGTGTRVRVESDAPLTVRCGDTSSPTPAEITLGHGRGSAPAFVLEDVRSKASVEVRIVRRR
jgi:hypothetical protein